MNIRTRRKPDGCIRFQAMTWRIEDFLETLVGYVRMLFFAASLWMHTYRVVPRRSRFYSTRFGWYTSLMLEVSKHGQHIATFDKVMFKYFSVKKLVGDVQKSPHLR